MCIVCLSSASSLVFTFTCIIYFSTLGFNFSLLYNSSNSFPRSHFHMFSLYSHGLLGVVFTETLPCPRPRGLMPSTRIVSPCFARPRFQLGLSSRAPLDLTKRARSTLSDRSWLALITMYSTLQVLQRGYFSSYARFLKTVLLPSNRQFRSST